MCGQENNTDCDNRAFSWRFNQHKQKKTLSQGLLHAHKKKKNAIEASISHHIRQILCSGEKIEWVWLCHTHSCSLAFFPPKLLIALCSDDSVVH